LLGSLFPLPHPKPLNGHGIVMNIWLSINT
jgi:hypothetical protein